MPVGCNESPKALCTQNPLKEDKKRDRFNKQDSKKGEEKNVSLTNSA